VPEAVDGVVELAPGVLTRTPDLDAATDHLADARDRVGRHLEDEELLGALERQGRRARRNQGEEDSHD
jgi:hypothetical protein